MSSLLEGIAPPVTVYSQSVLSDLNVRSRLTPVAFTLRRLHAAFHNRQSRLFASNPERRVEQDGACVILMTSLRRVTVMTQDNLRQYWIARILPEPAPA